MRAVSHCVVGLPRSSLSACMPVSPTPELHLIISGAIYQTPEPVLLATELFVGLTAIIETLWI